MTLKPKLLKGMMEFEYMEAYWQSILEAGCPGRTQKHAGPVSRRHLRGLAGYL